MGAEPGGKTRDKPRVRHPDPEGQGKAKRFGDSSGSSCGSAHIGGIEADPSTRALGRDSLERWRGGSPGDEDRVTLRQCAGESPVLRRPRTR